jgi:replicative DNA helicase
MSNDYDFLSRPAPCDLVTERALLGAVLVKPEILPGLLTGIDPQDFYEPRNEKLFEAMLRLLSQSAPVDDVAILVDALRRKGDLATFGGSAEDASRYIAAVAAESGAPSAARIYAGVIRNIALIRESGRAYYRLAQQSFEVLDARVFFAEAQSEVSRIYARLVSDEPEPAALDEVLEGIDSDYWSTGFRDFDNLLDGGFRAGQLVVLAAQTSRGKSALALNLASNLALAGQRVIFLSAEMSRKQLRQRLYFGEAGVSLKRRRFLSQEETRRLLLADDKLRELKLAIQYKPGLRPLDVRAEAQRLRSEWGGLALIVVDYVGLMSPDSRQERREREVASITRDLKLIAGEMNCVVLACAQLNRQIDHREQSPPRLSDLRDSGAIEQDADMVAFIHQPDRDEAQRKVIIAKNRDGALGEFTLAFRPELTRFEDADLPWADQAA